MKIPKLSTYRDLLPRLRVNFVIALLIWFGVFCGYYFFSRGLDPVPGPLAASLVNWDAKWYLDIAQHG